jgi:hypothetical protein
MTAMLSLPARAADRLSACIMDARLALAPGAIVLAVQLARFAPVWLTRRFWALVDEAYFYRRYPEELLPELAEEAGAGAMLEELAVWHAAWLNGNLDGVFFWIGDARRESALPINWNSELITRYERLAQSFSPEAEPASVPPADPLTVCAQEAFALAAALTADAPIILTTVQGSDDRPRICADAARVARLSVHGPGEWESGTEWVTRMIPAQLQPLLGQLACLGTRLAVVHTLAPAALTLASRSLVDDGTEIERPEPASELGPWSSAHVFWHAL